VVYNIYFIKTLIVYLWKIDFYYFPSVRSITFDRTRQKQ